MMSGSITDTTSQMADVDMAVNMSSTHDCCDTPSLICDHAGACDCDNTQVSYSVVPNLTTNQPLYLTSFKYHYIPSTFLSSSIDSLYRPPINIFL